MPTYQLDLIPRQTGVVIMKSTPLFVVRKPMGIVAGSGDADYTCGACSNILLGSLDGGVVFQGLVIECGICGAHNFVRGKHRPLRKEYVPVPLLPKEYVLTPLLSKIRSIVKQLGLPE